MIRPAMNRYTVQTLNVCFEAPDTFEVRFNHLVQSLLTHLPAIVCLQEVTEHLLTRLHGGLGDLYTISAPPPPYVDYYTLILCRKELRAKYERVPFHRQSAMMRDLLVARFDLPELKDLAVATTHLESLDSHHFRELQMKEIARVLDPMTYALLLGDFNFCSYRNYDERKRAPLQNLSLQTCLPEYVDQWPHLCGDNMGYTFDDARNQWKFSRVLPNTARKFRFDRIMAKLPPQQSSSIELENMRLVYDEPVARVNEPVPCKVYVSDHLGLELTIVCKNENDAAVGRKRQRVEEEKEVICLDGDEEVEDGELPVEPKQGEASVAIRLVLSSGKSQVQRSFAPDTTVRVLRQWAMSVDTGLENGKDFSIVEMPSGKEIASNESLAVLDRSTVRVIVK